VIRDIHRLFTATLQPLVSREGVTVCHWYYLRILSEHDGLTQRELSEKVGVHPIPRYPRWTIWKARAGEASTPRKRPAPTCAST